MELEAGTTIARMQPVGRLPRFEEPFLSGENRPTGTETFSRSLSVEPIHCRAPTAMLRRYCENLEQATPFPNRSEEFSVTFPGSLAQLCATIFLRIVQQVEYPLDMRTIFGLNHLMIKFYWVA
jgi:hypothetical protein